MKKCSYHSSGIKPSRTLPGSPRTGLGKFFSSRSDVSEAEPRATTAVEANCRAATEAMQYNINYVKAFLQYIHKNSFTKQIEISLFRQSTC